MVTLLNRSARRWDLKPGKDAKGNLVKRSLMPGGTIEALDKAEADHMLGYREIVDAEKVIPAIADKNKRIQDLEAQVKGLTENIDELKARLEKYEPSKGKGKDKDGGK